MFRQIFIAFLFFIAIFCAFALKPAQATELKGMRFHNHAEKIQFVLDMSQATSFSQFSLADPPRLVIDLPDTDLRTRAGMSIAQGSVERVRTGKRDKHTLRVVIDLRQASQVNIYTLNAEGSKPFRIVADIFKPNKRPVLRLESLNTAPSKNLPEVTFAGRKLSEQQVEQNIRQQQQEQQHSLPAPVKPGANELAQSQPKAEVTEISKRGKVTARRAVPLRKQDKRRNTVVVLDPGHGGKDPGAVSSNGLKEKTVVLEIAKRVQKYLNQKQGIKAYLTRSDDRFIPLRQRVEIARQHSADLFISIHADNFKPNPSARGSSVYILSTRGASSEAARWLAESENAADMRSGLALNRYDEDVRGVMLDIMQEGTLESSHKVAGIILSSIDACAKLHKRSVERAGFAVLKAPDIPSVLIETAFLSNAQDAKLLRTAQFQDRIARQIADGIDRYFKEHLPQHLIEAGGR